MANTDELLERIASTLERIEVVLEEKANKTQEAKDCRELMQQIVRYYKETAPPINIQAGHYLQIYRFRDAIARIKNIRNTKLETRKLNRWIKKLEDREFITRTSADMFQVLHTGKSWEEL